MKNSQRRAMFAKMKAGTRVYYYNPHADQVQSGYVQERGEKFTRVSLGSDPRLNPYQVRDSKGTVYINNPYESYNQFIPRKYAKTTPKAALRFVESHPTYKGMAERQAKYQREKNQDRYGNERPAHQRI